MEDKKKKELIEFSKKYFYYAIVVLILIVPLAYMFIPKFGKKVEKVNYLSNIPNPVQEKWSGIEYDELDGKEVRIYLNYKYSISGRVLHFADYSNKGSWHERLIPFDLGLGWGPLSGSNLDKYFSFTHENTWAARALRTIARNTPEAQKWVSNLGDEVLDTHLSNNHLYPANKEIFDALKKIKKNECIRLDGYLVRVETQTREGQDVFMESSYLRNDYWGNGSCEVIYVTDVTWLISK